MQEQQLEFQKVPKDKLPPMADSRPEYQQAALSSEMMNPGPFSRVFGVLKGTVAVASETDITAPANVEWDAAR